MGSSGGKAPPAPNAPDPMKTAQAQAGLNRETAAYEMSQNMISQYTPQGNLVYQMVDEGNPKKGIPPKFIATQTLSPKGQQAFDLEQDFDIGANKLAVDQVGRLSTLLSEPVSLDNDAVEGRLMELARKRLDPVLAERKAALETKLYNQGVRPGTEAWDREMRSVLQGENDAYNELLLRGRGQSIEEILAQRNQPINEITALMGAQQIARPSFVNTPQSNVASPDMMGLASNNYATQAGLYNSAQNRAAQENAAMWGAAGSIGGVIAKPLGGWMFSDARLKTDVARVGETDNGFGVYSYRFIGSPEVHLGLMAQEVEKVRPEAVKEVAGIKLVNYELALA
jgi:hypothetical protein